ncbi:MAG: glycosyltransferase family 2 protein [Candidatus Kerfeldbacteria bacterium]|nr:glycosyltransferase family 2 protein [Candidatus Kerfeldbacteria bacterium]
MQASIILVSHNAKDHIADCVRALRAFTTDIEYEVIVSDNGSTDGTQAMLKLQFPWVRLIENKKNLGFGAANNRGAQVAEGDMLFFFNDDTVLTENSVRIAYDYMKQRSEIGCLGFHLTFPDGSHQDSVRAYPKVSDQALTLLKLHHAFPRAKALQRYLLANFDYAKEQEVDQVMGACMIIPHDVFERVGGFDESFFLWFEEVDLQKRIHEELKLKIMYAPLTSMIHVKGATFGKKLSLQNQRNFNESVKTYFQKHESIRDTKIIAFCTYPALALARLVQFLDDAFQLRKRKNKQL